MFRIKYFFYVSVLSIFLLSVGQTQESVLSPDEVNAMEKGAYNTEEEMSAELKGLYSQLEDLKQQLANSEQQKNNLNDQLEAYKQKEHALETKNSQLKVLQKLANKPNFKPLLPDIDADNAYYSLNLGNLEAAQLKFLSFLAKDPTQFPEYAKANADALNKKERLADFNHKLQLDKDKADFFLGRIYLLQADYKNTLAYLSVSYKSSNDYDIIVYSLLGVMESFEALGKKQEACLTIKSLQNAADTIKKSNVNYEFPENFVVTLQAKQEHNNCEGATFSKSNKQDVNTLNSKPADKPAQDVRKESIPVIPSSANTPISNNGNQVESSTIGFKPIDNNSNNLAVDSSSTASVHQGYKAASSVKEGYVNTSDLYPTANRNIRTTLPGSAPVTDAEKEALKNQPKKPAPNLQAPKIPEDAYAKLGNN
ncbi:Chromosome segregation ATPase [Candidatus Hepatincola sp. Av]